MEGRLVSVMFYARLAHGAGPDWALTIVREDTHEVLYYQRGFASRQEIEADIDRLIKYINTLPGCYAAPREEWRPGLLD
jgi:hypothetical protein